MTEPVLTEEPILVAEHKGILTVTFNRPRKKNALTHEMYTRLVEALEQAKAAPRVRAMCFRGAGQCFCSGNDLADFLTNPPNSEESPVFRFLKGLIDFPKPLVAAVEGAAVGIGTTMLLHCDLVYASETALFQMPFTRLALCPEAASSFLLPRVIGLTRASRLLLLGDSIDANTALKWGLITEMLPADSFEAVVAQRLETLAALPPDAVRAAKALLREPLSEAAHEAVRREVNLFAQRLASEEAAEALQAFLERRPPDFGKFV